MRIKYSVHHWSDQRAQILANLNRQVGHHLVIVRYVRHVPGDSSGYAEWVYNEADIDNAKVVWAREMDAERNNKLLAYFKERQIWLLTSSDDRPAELVKISNAQAYNQAGAILSAVRSNGSHN